MGISNRLCMPLNSSFDLYGKLSLSVVSSIAIRINRCNNTSNATRPCANSSVLDTFLSPELGVYTLSIYAVNPIINPGSTDYLDWEVDDSTSLTFSFQQGSMLSSTLEDYTI